MLAALTLAPAALALPDGFRVSARLTPRAQAISGGVGQVACPTNWTVWLALQREHGANAGNKGMTVYAEQTAYLPPDTCATLEGWLRGKSPRDNQTLAENIETFIHEAMHLRGVIDEREAECTALLEYRSRARSLFGVKNARKLRAMFAYAVAANRRLPDEYRCY